MPRNAIQNVTQEDVRNAYNDAGVNSFTTQLVAEIDNVITRKTNKCESDGTPYNHDIDAIVSVQLIHHYHRQNSLDKYPHRPLGWHTSVEFQIETSDAKWGMLIALSRPAADPSDLDSAIARMLNQAQDPAKLLHAIREPKILLANARLDAAYGYLTMTKASEDTPSDCQVPDLPPEENITTEIETQLEEHHELADLPLSYPYSQEEISLITSKRSACDRASSSSPIGITASVSNTFKVADHILDEDGIIDVDEAEILVFDFPSTWKGENPHHPGHIKPKRLKQESEADPLPDKLQFALVKKVRGGSLGRPYPPFRPRLRKFYMRKRQARLCAWAGDGSAYHLVARTMQKYFKPQIQSITPKCFNTILKGLTTNLVFGSAYDADGFFQAVVGEHNSGDPHEVLVLHAVQSASQAEIDKWCEDFLVPLIQFAKSKWDELQIGKPKPTRKTASSRRVSRLKRPAPDDKDDKENIPPPAKRPCL